MGSSVSSVLFLVLITFCLTPSTSKEVKILTKKLDPRTAALFKKILPASHVLKPGKFREKKSLYRGGLEETLLDGPVVVGGADGGGPLMKRQRPFRPRPPRPGQAHVGGYGCRPWSCVNRCPLGCDNLCSANAQCYCSCPEDEAVYEYYDPPSPFFTEEIIAF